MKPNGQCYDIESNDTMSASVNRYQQYTGIFMVLLLVFESYIEVVAQEKYDSLKYNSVFLSAGINQIKEENLHLKVHEGSVFNLGYSHYKRRKHASLVDLSFSYARPKTRLEDVSSSANGNFCFAFSYLFNSPNQGPTYHHSLGPKASINYNASYYPAWDDSHLYWSSSFSLGIRDQVTFSISPKGSMILDFSLDLLGIYSRPPMDRPYKIDDLSFDGVMKALHSGIEFGFVNKFVGLTCILEYQFRLTRKYHQSLFYQLQYRAVESQRSDPFRNSISSVGVRCYFL